MIRLCLHGAESTGKSVLAARLSHELGLPWVPEYGREYAETHGTSFTMADLLAIAEGHEQRVQEVTAGSAGLVLLDTDPLMTAAWAEMLFGEAPERLFAFPKADQYLLFSPDVPWVEDGTRFFGEQRDRARFAALAEAVLVRADVPFTQISGNWDERGAQVRAAIAALLKLTQA